VLEEAIFRFLVHNLYHLYGLSFFGRKQFCKFLLEWFFLWLILIYVSFNRVVNY
jgi:hypothetical protein